MNPIAGIYALKALCDALGLQGRPVTKVVIEMAVDGAMKVYVVEIGQREQVERLVPLLAQARAQGSLNVEKVKDVEVKDDASITVAR